MWVIVRGGLGALLGWGVSWAIPIDSRDAMLIGAGLGVIARYILPSAQG